jgi:hypothetical protein
MPARVFTSLKINELMKRMFLLMAFFTAAYPVLAQKSSYNGFPSLVWPKLYDVQFIKASDDKGEYDKPIFSTAAKSLQGKVISLPGYIIPFESGLKNSHLMFSSLPLNACFFCGVGGPETVIEVFLKKEISYTEKPMEIQGTLKLNDKDPDKMIYILENAEILGEAGFN